MSVIKIVNSRWLSKVLFEKKIKVCCVLTGNINSTLKIPAISLSTNRGELLYFYLSLLSFSSDIKYAVNFVKKIILFLKK